jgi:hypothetical protein
MRGHLAAAFGRLAEADGLLDTCDVDARERCAPWTQAVVLSIHSRVCVQLGLYDRAERLAGESIRILSGLRDIWVMRNALTHLAAADSLRSNPRRAARLYGAADGLRERCGSAIVPVYQDFDEGRRASVAGMLGPDVYDALLREGRALSLENIAALATDREPGPVDAP